MTFREDNAEFEDWLRKRCLLNGCDVVEADIEYKHDQMASDPFVFLRATFFRWAQRIETLLPELAEAPSVLSVGDTHLENFGTWRDNEGRLVWASTTSMKQLRSPIHSISCDWLRASASPTSQELAIMELQPLSLKDIRVGWLRHVRPCSTSRKRGCARMSEFRTRSGRSFGRDWMIFRQLLHLRRSLRRCKRAC